MRKKRFIQNMLGLSVSALLIRGVGMVWAVNAAQIMGAEMLGRYRLIVSVYAFFLLAAAAGVSVTVTRLAGEELARGNEGAVSFIRSRAVSAAFCIGAALGVCMFIASFFLPAGFFGSGAANALRVLSPALPLAGFSSAVRGYFTARRKNLRNAAEQLIEQLTELFVFIWSCRLLEGAGFSPIFCAALATTSAEAVSFIYSAALLCYDTRHTPPPEKISGLFPRARSVFVPCTASAGLRSALSLAESCLIPAGLMVSAGNGGAAMEDFGIITGMALPCVMFPSVFILMLEEPIDALYFIIIIVIIQQIDGNIIGPNIVGNAIGISSFWILISVLIGGGLFGFPGMALGVPVFAVFYRYADKLTMASLRRKDKDTTTAYYFSLEPYGIEDDEVALDTDSVKKASLFDKLKPKKTAKDNKYIYDQKGSIVDGNAEEIRRLIEREKNRE